MPAYHLFDGEAPLNTQRREYFLESSFKTTMDEGKDGVRVIPYF
jgi:hypothetical protein